MNQVNETALAFEASNAFAAKVRAGLFRPVARHLQNELRKELAGRTGLEGVET
jgi:hypothetical protein